jgi:hypothetical protein
MEAQALQETGLTSDEWMEAQADQFDAITAGGEFRRLAELARSDIEPDLDALFEFGLALMLDGLEQYVEARALTLRALGRAHCLDDVVL